MGKIIIDTPDATFYYCGNCAQKVTYDSSNCNNCNQPLTTERAFQVSSDFDPNKSILDQLDIFEGAVINNAETEVKTAKKLQVNSEGASFFYCKNCRSSVGRTNLQCRKCNSLFNSIIKVDSDTDIFSRSQDSGVIEDRWQPPIENDTNTLNHFEPLDPKTQTSQFTYVGFWKRVFAYFLDTIILWILSFFVGGFLGAIFVMLDIGFTEGIFHLLGFLVTWIYFAWWESSEKQATIGKMAINAKVVDNKGERLSFGNASGRYFSKILSALLLGFGFLMVAFTDKKQGLHDYLADTRVISNSL